MKKFQDLFYAQPWLTNWYIQPTGKTNIKKSIEVHFVIRFHNGNCYLGELSNYTEDGTDIEVLRALLQPTSNLQKYIS